jgi:hypothetical protein
MYRIGMSRRARRLTIGAVAAAMVGGALAVSTGLGQAAEDCGGLDTALRNNQNFIAGQRANPDALSDARIENREAVIALIQQRRAAAGCTGGQGADEADPSAAPADPSCPPAAPEQPGDVEPSEQPEQPGEQAPGEQQPGQQEQPGDVEPSEEPEQPGEVEPSECASEAPGEQPGGQPSQPPAEGSDVVCDGSTVTLSGEGGAPAASSGELPIGTRIKVTNLDNNKSTTVEVTGASDSCMLLNNAAFEQVREPGKFLIRRAVIERVGTPSGQNVPRGCIQLRC